MCGIGLVLGDADARADQASMHPLLEAWAQTVTVSTSEQYAVTPVCRPVQGCCAGGGQTIRALQRSMLAVSFCPWWLPSCSFGVRSLQYKCP